MPIILYQDKYLVVINKPSGLLSVPGIGPDKQDCAIVRVQKENSEAKVVHRLDCYTSGVMLFALGIEAQRELNRQFRDREVQKEYVAVVEGVVEDDGGVIDLPMRCDIDNRPFQIIDFEHGKNAETHWSVLQRNKNTTRLKLLPVTGRSHQLRVHCKEMGYPIVGDGLYGNNKDGEQMLLHARQLEITHPGTEKRIAFEAPCNF